MTLISSIIADAYRESNMLALGAVPSANQVTEALRLYNAVMAAIYGGDAGERLTEWPLGTFDQNPANCDYVQPFTDCVLYNPEVNMRLIAVNPSAATVYFPNQPQDGARMGITDPYGRLATAPITIDGNGRPIEGVATLLLNTNGLSREWMYRGDLSAWVKVSDLLATDQNPFPITYDMMFIILLAVRLNPRYGRTLDPQSAEMLKNNRREFIARYLQSRPLEINDSISWPFLSTQGYDTQRAFSSTRGFNRGSYFGE